MRVTSSAVAGRVRPRAVVAAVVRRCVDTGAAAASSSTASPPAPPLPADPRYVDSAAAPASFPLSSALVYPEAVSEREADALVQDIQLRMKRRRYEKGHWDAVIKHYKEIEMPLPSEVSISGGESGGPHSLSDLSVAAINRIRADVRFNCDRLVLALPSTYFKVCWDTQHSGRSTIVLLRYKGTINSSLSLIALILS